jgi:hypothetical protein
MRPHDTDAPAGAAIDSVDHCYLQPEKFEFKRSYGVDKNQYRK